MPKTSSSDSVSPEEAKKRLTEGNQRFRQADKAWAGQPWDKDQAEGQAPFATILACSDSRAPVEILFDQGFSDLFVIRVAGNVVAPSIIGSVEFASSQFGTRLVVVMGHTRCGAIAATIDSIKTGTPPESSNLRDITERISPYITDVVASGGDDVARKAMKANVRASVSQLRHGSKLLEELVQSGRVEIIGAEYELESGAVRFL